jgi:hypothetical protein
MPVDLEKAIDQAVHDWMDAEPRADLRARVMEQIERSEASVGRVFRPGVRWGWVLAPVAAAAVVVLAIVLGQPQQPLVTRAVTQIVVRPAETRMPPTILHREDRQSPPPRILAVAAQDRRIAAAVAAEASQPTIELEALRPIEAISTPPVALPALDTQPIGPPPLAPLAEIEIEPVNSSAGRN